MHADKRALIVVTSHDQLADTGKRTGWYLSEVTHVYYPLIAAGFSVDFASPMGGEAPMDESSRKLDDPDNKRFVEDAALMTRMRETMALSSVDPGRYSVVHFAGGHGVMWDFPGHPEIQRVAAGIYDHGGIVAAVCHGPAALVDVKLADGSYLVTNKAVSGFTNAEEDAAGLTDKVPFLLETKLRERGADFQPGAMWSSQTAISERLITGQNPQSAKAVGELIVKAAASL